MKEQCLFRRDEGSILIAVLWSLFFLSALAAAIHSYVSPQLGLAEHFRDRTKMYFLAKSGVARAVVEIQNDETLEYDALNETWSNNDDGFKDVETSVGTFSLEWEYEGLLETETKYGLTDEERLISINTASSSVLKGLFETAGELTSQESGDIANSIIDWRDEDNDLSENGAEDGYYQTLNPSYDCKNVNFDSIEEVLFVKGMTQDIFSKIKNYITIYGSGAININTVGSVVLESLGFDSLFTDKIISFRVGIDQISGNEDDGVFSAVEGITATLNASESLSAEELGELTAAVNDGFFTVKSDYFKGVSIGRLSERRGVVQIVFVIDRSGSIKYWRE